MNLDQPEKPSVLGMPQECDRCKERDQLGLKMSELQQQLDSPHIKMQSDKAYGSPTRYKGKRESLPPMGSSRHAEMTM